MLMNNLQNKQLFSILVDYVSHKFLKLCYFMVLGSFLISCGNDKSPKNSETLESGTKEVADAPTETKTNTILFFGDSITAGYGLQSTDEAYPALIQKKIDSLGFDYTVINSGVSGETTAGGKSRIDWILNQDIAIFILELGANDGLRGVTVSETQRNLQAIIDAVRAKNASTEIILAGMELPPNMGRDYTAEFRAVFSNLAETNDVEFIPFILKDVGGIAELNQNDGIHPTAKGHSIIANTVWEYLEPLLKS